MDPQQHPFGSIAIRFVCQENYTDLINFLALTKLSF